MKNKTSLMDSPARRVVITDMSAHAKTIKINLALRPSKQLLLLTSGDGHPVIPIRPYDQSDRGQIEVFVCVPPWKRWVLVAQEIIQESPDECENGNAEVFVAAEGSDVLGVIVFREDPRDGSKWEICSIGILIDRQNEGIGQSLKNAVIAEIVARKGILDFISTLGKFQRSTHADRWNWPSLNFMYCNFARPHQSLRVKNADGTFTKRSPAMAAGLSDHIWSTWEIAAQLDAN